MKHIIVIAVLFSFAFTHHARAEDSLVACQNCTETQYKQMAELAAGNDAYSGTYVQVMDFENANLRKYYVLTTIEDLEGIFLELTTTIETTPTADEIEFFDSTSSMIDELTDNPSMPLDCGPGGFGDYLVPDFNFESACTAHDFCYGTGGGSADRLACDQTLRIDILDAGHPILSMLYFLGVRLGGGFAFNFTTGQPPGNSSSMPICKISTSCDVIVIASGS